MVQVWLEGTLSAQHLPGERGYNPACSSRLHAYIPTALGAGDAARRSVADPWQRQKQKALVFGPYSDSQSLSLQLPVGPRRRKRPCAEPFLPV